MRKRLRAAVVASCTAAAVLFTGVVPAHAIDPISVASTAASAAYEAFKSYRDGRITLSSATQRIINAINQAKTDILNEIGDVEAGHIWSCTNTAFIELLDAQTMTPDHKQDFADDATRCITDATEAIGRLDSLAAVDQVGFALNSVGPIGLFARRYAHGAQSPGILALRDTLIAANRALKTKLKPSCSPTPLWGDAEPGAAVEVILTCRAFDGTIGRDSVCGRGRRDI